MVAPPESGAFQQQNLMMAGETAEGGLDQFRGSLTRAWATARSAAAMT